MSHLLYTYTPAMSFLVGLSGTCPLSYSPPIEVHWHAVPSLGSRHLQQGTHALVPGHVLFEQGMLPSPQHDYQDMLRIALCGLAWIGTRTFGRDDVISDLYELQHILDTHYPPRLNDLDGDFILTYVPLNQACCFLYRSVTGTRALYYRIIKDILVWSTTLRDIFLDSKPTLTMVDHEMLAVLASTADVTPTRTCYRDVTRLPAGYCLQIHPDGSMCTTISDFEIQEDNAHLPRDEAAYRLRSHVENAIGRRLGGAAQVGVLLSGGLDSAIVAYEATKFAGNVEGFHWTWDAFPMFHDEKRCAEQVAEKLGIGLTTLDFSDTVDTDGDYLRCMEGLSLPFNHSFFRCFVGSAAAGAQHHIGIMATGHLGDVAFQGDWADPFLAGLCPRWHPLRLVKTYGHLLSWYSRKQALMALIYLCAAPRPNHRLDFVRVERCRSWLTPHAFEQALQQGRSLYQRDLPSLSTHEIYRALKQAIDSNADLDTDLITQVFLPQNIVLLHPYADRPLLEFCLSLGPHHRSGFDAGSAVSKLLLRYAYLGVVPPSVVGREVRSPYAAVAEHYCRNNRDELQQVFGTHSLLAQAGVIDSIQIRRILSTPDELQKNSLPLLRAASVELWLRSLGADRQHTILPTAKEIEYRAPHGVGSAKKPLARVGEGIIVKEVNGLLVLLNQQTKLVMRLNERGSLLWHVFTQVSSWQEACARVHQQQANQQGDDEVTLRAFALHLQCEHLLLFSENVEMEKPDVLYMDNRDLIPTDDRDDHPARA